MENAQTHRMPQRLHLHRDYSQRGGFVSRVYLSATIRHSRYENVYYPLELNAVIDSGAESSIIPRKVVRWFEEKNFRLIRGRVGDFRLADGSPRSNVPGYEVEFILSSPRETDGQRGRVRFDTATVERGEAPPCCFAFDMYEGSEQIILGMDLLRFWRIVLDGEGNDFSVVIPEKRNRMLKP